MDTLPFIACCGRPSCVREMLKDSRVKVNEPNDYGQTPPGVLLIMATLVSSSGGSPLKGIWIWGHQGISI